MNNDFEEALGPVIEDKSRVLANFMLEEKGPCGPEGMKKLLWAWCRNFDGLLNDYTLLATLVKEIEIIEDNVILADFYKAKKMFSQECKSLFFCPFGEPQSSSYRIMASLNSNPNYNDSLRNLLTKIGNAKEAVPEYQYPGIVFIDDFLNSGGQFRRILNDWATADLDSIQDTDSRVCDNLYLSANQLKTLKQCSLFFYLYVCTENKRLELESELRKIFPNGRIINHKTIPDNGIFGTEEDVKLIINKSEAYLSGKSIFDGKTGKDVFELYHVCKEAGLQLLRTNEPDWKEEKIQERCLGYGNSPRLFIGQNNIPTLTMTALWQSGSVNIDGKSFYWQKFLPRRKKITEQPENKRKPLKPIVRLDEKGNNSAPPLELHIIGDLESLPKNDSVTIPESCRYLYNYFHQQAADSLELNLKTLDKRNYAKFNNHLKWGSSEEEPDTGQMINASISRIQFLPYDAGTIFSAHIKVNADNMCVDQLYPLLKQARIADYRPKKKGNGTFLLIEPKNGLQRYCVSELLFHIFDAVNLKIKNQKSFFLMYVMRLDSDSPSCTDLELNSELIQNLTMNASDHFDIKDFESAAVAVSDKISAFISRSCPVNDSGILQKEVADIYCFLEMLNKRFIDLMEMKKFSPETLTEQDEKTLESDMLFLRNAYSTNRHVKEYMSLLQTRIGGLLV